ncbi:MAG: 4-hydroxy-3-methylbut-2-enyl diphosphate reductase [Bacteroidales bacterium]|nr:4-hydroxy-3-methylbut-2-enyl diphosphate reductase [Bacteroidales bacterium]MDY3783379.1 4-hydroxy-3-methylbut-2-enyl diphosphate reductase [Candidatus Cryptobacteroides sp.]
MARVEIDPHSGFCGGVIRAIRSAEDFLSDHERLYSLGAIVHNEEELERLASQGLVCIDSEDLSETGDATGETLLIRAHGEPPKTYTLASQVGFSIIDCTCPVVLQLQQSIREAYARLSAPGVNGQLLIFGKIGHAEVLGLVGQVEGRALVVENTEQLRNLFALKLLLPDCPVEVFSQTTMSPSAYEEVSEALTDSMDDPSLVTVHKTICRQVAYRHRELSEFALAHDVIIFVSGKASSNGRVLCELCKSVNIRTYHIGSPSELQSGWFRPDDSVGVCGATSTPRWLLEKVASAIENLQ